MNSGFFPVIIVSVLLYSCLDKENFSDVPHVKYENISIDYANSSVVLKISFTDGDGDIGFKDGEEQYPFGPCHPFHHNLLIDPYYMDNGKFVLARILPDSNCPTKDDSIGYYYRTAYIEPEGKDKSLEGEISVILNGVLLDFPNDTVKFRIWLIDRALHSSNKVESEAVITP